MKRYLIFFFFLVILASCDNYQFSSVKWSNESCANNWTTERKKAVNYLKNHYVFIGKNKQEILDKLPLRNICFDDFSPRDQIGKNSEYILYVISYNKWNIDLDIEETLYLKFDHDIVVEASIHRLSFFSSDWEEIILN